MPRKCSVIGCRGNYRKRKNTDDEVNNHVSVFRFPKDELRRKEWLRKIPQEGLTPDNITDNMGVCEQHFDARFIIRDHTFNRPDGSTFKSPRMLPVLSDDAIPTLFPNTPSYLSTAPAPKRKHPDDRRAEATARDEQLFQTWHVEEDIISDFDSFRSNLSSKAVDLGSDWILVSKEHFCLFVNIDSCNCPTVIASFKVCEDMTVLIFDNKLQRNSSELTWLLGDANKLTRWSQLPNICSHWSNTCRVPVKPETVEDHVSVVTGRLKQLIHASKNDDQNDEKTTLEFRLNFLLQQFELLYSVQKRYSPECMVTAFTIFCSSRSTYCYLRESCLTLPHTSTLRNLTSCFSQCCQTLTDDDAHFVYLKHKCMALPECERLVVLLLDEIYVRPKVTYKGGNLQGFAENSTDSVQATTVQAYMIASVLSKHKDVAALQPIKNLEMSFFHDSVMKVLSLVETAGYRVLAVLSDNNRANRNMFEKMCDGILQPSVPHPLDSERRLLFFYSTPFI